MVYHPSAQDALRAYMAVVVHLHGVPSSDSAYPGVENVTMIGADDFVILDVSGRDTLDSLLAICSYLSVDDFWAVQLQDDESLGVRNTGGRFVVIEE